MQLNNLLEVSAEQHPAKIALVCGEHRYTYAELDRMASRLAAWLVRSGVQRGDRVAVFLDNSVEAVIAVFGTLKAGAAFVMINPTTRAGKLEYLLNQSGARVLVTDKGKAGLVRVSRCPALRHLIIAGLPEKRGMKVPYASVVAERETRAALPCCIDLDLAAILYTSGSTGHPKGVMLSHLNMLSAVSSITSYLENTPDEVILNVLPLSFDYGLYQLFMGFGIGGTVILERSFIYPYRILETMVREKVTGFPGVPTIFALLLQMKELDAFDLGSVRYVTNTAAALPESHLARLRVIFPAAKIYSMYGLTECKRVSYLAPGELDRRPGSVGRAMPNVEVWLVNDRGEHLGPGETGELVVRGSNVMMGYWDDPESTAACLRPGRYPGERVLYTGDLFRTDEEGFLYFVARRDDIIKCKGEKVSPREVENVLCSCAGIAEAAVIGLPDPVLGQSVQAHVTLVPGAALREQDILRHCARHLESFMLPKSITIMDTLPRTQTGKIDKLQLQQERCANESV